MENLFMRENLDKLHGFKDDGTGEQNGFTLFTKVDVQQNLMNLCASDGDALYTKVILGEDLNALADDCDATSKGDLLSKIRVGIVTNSFSVSSFEDHAIVQIQKGSSSFSLRLFTPTASERKVLLKYSYCQMAQRMQEFQEKITAIENELIEAKKNTFQQAPVEAPSSIFEPDFKRPKQSKRKPTKGGSLINPGVRRKKAASGVVFDD